MAILVALAVGQTITFANNSSPEPRFINNRESNWLQQSERTGNWGGFRRKLENSGITIGLGLSQVYQYRLQGETGDDDSSERYSGRYDLELEIDLEKLINVSGARIHALFRGGWADGTDASPIGSFCGMNSIAVGDRAMDVWQLYFEQSFANENTFFRIGKIDLTGEYDANAFANDETSQFLMGSLVNNPTIPFPDPGLGALLHLGFAENWYVSAAIADADADVRESGFNTAFRAPGNFVAMLETGFLTRFAAENGALEGTYRFGLWHDHQNKEHFEGGGSESGDTGIYLSFDQMIFRESSNADNHQGAALFARLGYANDKVNEIQTFWSLGAQYQGLFPGRDDDVIAMGISQARLSGNAGFSALRETSLELYYQAAVFPWLSLSSSLQYVSNPGGSTEVDNAIVAGVRAQINF